jgi:hypothetical protein
VVDIGLGKEYITSAPCCVDFYTLKTSGAAFLKQTSGQCQDCACYDDGMPDAVNAISGRLSSHLGSPLFSPRGASSRMDEPTTPVIMRNIFDQTLPGRVPSLSDDMHVHVYGTERHLCLRGRTHLSCPCLRLPRRSINGPAGRSSSPNLRRRGLHNIHASGIASHRAQCMKSIVNIDRVL